MTIQTYQKPEAEHLGIFADISDTEYHRGRGISKSGLDLIDQSPAIYITHKRHPKPFTPAMHIGHAFHCLVLEPAKFEALYIPEPRKAPRRPTDAQLNAKNKSLAAEASIEFWAEWDEENKGKHIITNRPGDDPFWNPGHWDQIHRMAESVQSHPEASIFLNPGSGRFEHSAYWVDKATGKLCKCRPDFINDAHNLVVDLKSTIDASFTGFSKAAGNYRYYIQDPFYSDGLEAIGEKQQGFVFVAVDKDPPYGVASYACTSEQRRIGRLQIQRNLEVYAKCHNEDIWPAYPEGVRELDIPFWGLKGKIN